MSLYTQLYVYNLCPFQFNYRPFRRKPESIDTTKLHNFLKKTNHRLIYFPLMGDCIKKATATSVEVQWLNVSLCIV